MLRSSAASPAPTDCSSVAAHRSVQPSSTSPPFFCAAADLRQVKSEPDTTERPASAQQGQQAEEAVGQLSSASFASPSPSPPPPVAPLIDLSTPESLERDFHAWLKGELRGRGRFFSECSAKTPPPTSLFLKAELSPSLPASSLLDLAILPAGQRRLSLPPVQLKGESPSAAGLLFFSSAGQSPSSSTHSSSSSSSSSCPGSSSSNGGGGGGGCCADSPIQQATTAEGGGERLVLIELGRSTASCPAAEGRLQASAESPGSRSSGVNQLGRTYSPGLPLSMSERQQIVELHRAGWKICDISKYLCVTHSCVSKILQRFRTTGSVRPKDAKEGRQESPLVAAIRDYRLRLGIVRQSEIREQLIRDGLCRRENAPSRSSINHILRTKLNLMDIQQQKKVVEPEHRK